MQNNNDCQGVFAVRLDARRGELVAELTGDHFGQHESDIANAIAGNMTSRAFMDAESPAYLVRDSVVGVAVRAMRRARENGREAFTRAVLGTLELGRSDLSDRLRGAVASAIGMTWIDAPWDGAMSDEEVESVFDETRELGLCQEKVKEG